MAVAASWKDVFCQWPAEMPRRGVLIAGFGEQIPFVNFSTSDGFLLLERQAPDVVGARTILLSYDNVVGLKLIDAVKPRAFQSLGFDMAVLHK